MCNCENSGPSDEFWINFQNLASIEHMLVSFDLSSSGQSFDLTLMMSQWHEFLHSSCGFETPDPHLVLALTMKHAELFSALLHEMKIDWDGVQGSFLCLTKNWTAVKAEGSPKEMADMFTWMWKDTFDEVGIEHYDEVETSLWHEKEHGLLG